MSTWVLGGWALVTSFPIFFTTILLASGADGVMATTLMAFLFSFQVGAKEETGLFLSHDDLAVTLFCEFSTDLISFHVTIGASTYIPLSSMSIALPTFSPIM